MRNYLQFNGIWYAIPRFAFMGLYSFNIMTCGTLIFFFAPLTSYLFFNDSRFWIYLKYFPKINRANFKNLFSLLKNSEHRDVFKVRWTGKPRLSPDPERISIRNEWRKKNGDSCNGCVACCEHIGCPLIDYEKKGCLVYGSFFWKYFTCGSFPLNQEQIEFYGCKKWQERR